MGRPYLSYLHEDGRIYCCRQCNAHLATESGIVSKHFHAKSGRAYLFDFSVNTVAGPAEDRLMTTGLHQVCELSCNRCQYTVGWRYELAYEKSQKYKEGKVLLERACVLSMENSEDGESELSESEPEDY